MTRGPLQTWRGGTEDGCHTRVYGRWNERGISGDDDEIARAPAHKMWKISLCKKYSARNREKVILTCWDEVVSILRDPFQRRDMLLWSALLPILTLAKAVTPSTDSFHESLTLHPLPDGRLSVLFEFTTYFTTPKPSTAAIGQLPESAG